MAPRGFGAGKGVFPNEGKVSLGSHYSEAAQSAVMQATSITTRKAAPMMEMEISEPSKSLTALREPQSLALCFSLIRGNSIKGEIYPALLSALDITMA